MEQEHRGFRKFLADKGIADTRIESLHKGTEELWKALCDLDSSQLKLIKEMGGLPELMRGFGENEIANRNIQKELDQMQCPTCGSTSYHE